MAASAWLGAAILTAAVVAPAAFKVLPTRTLAGALVGEVLPVLFISGALLAAGIILGVKTGRPRVLWLRVAASIWIVAMLVAQFAVTPAIQRIRSSVSDGIDALAADDPLRVRFGQLHGISVALLGVGML